MVDSSIVDVERTRFDTLNLRSMQNFTTDLIGVGVGSLLADRYEIEEVLGKGGMGAVFGVRDKALGRELCALKILDPRLCDTVTDLERFKQEVLISRRLSHPNIVRTFEFGQLKTGQTFVVMEYVRGKSLEQFLLESPLGLPLPFILSVLIEIAKGMGYAHANGVVHRDLKPGNLLVTKEGHVKIVDFGLARSIELQARLTQTGECVGTPMYMSPEQVRGHAADHRADVYGLGVVAYELFSGSAPFPPESWFELANSIVSQPLPKLTRGRGKTPAWLEHFVEKCCAKDPNQRFQSMAEVQEFLENQLANLETDAPQPWVIAQVFEGLAGMIQREATKFLLIGAGLVTVIASIGMIASSSEKSKTTVGEGTDAVEKMVDTLTKLNQVVQSTVENSDKIDKFLKEEQKKQAERQAPQDEKSVNVAKSAPSVQPTPTPEKTPAKARAR